MAGRQFEQALQHHQAGRLAEAEPLYKQALNLNPEHPDALHLLGVLYSQSGRHDEAIDLIGQAIAVKDSPIFHNNLGMAYKNTGRFAEAEASFRRALALKADDPGAHFNLGCVLGDTDRREEAVAEFKRAVELAPGYAEALHNLGSVLQELKKPEEAEDAYRRALAVNPDYAEACNNLAVVLKEQGNLEEAVSFYEHAVRINPDFMAAWNNLAHALKRQGKLKEATAAYQRTIALDPKNADTYNDLGVAWKERGFLDEAILCYEKAIELDPKHSSAYTNLANAFREQGRMADAIECYRRAIKETPSASYYSNLLLSMVYASFISPEDIADTAREFGERLCDPVQRRQSHANTREPERKLRIGYISADFCYHAVNYFFEPLLRAHDRQNFEIFGYSQTRKHDFVTERLKQRFDHWREIWGVEDEDVADMIEADKIDILVDITGHTGYNRLLVFAHKPAPVQVTWLGFPATTGVKAIDYRITDNYAEPAGMTEHLNVEKLWHLPTVFACYGSYDKNPEVIDHPPFEDNGYITFGCFNFFAKVTDEVLQTWSRIMAQVPDSRLLLEINGITSPVFRPQVEARLKAAGIPLERVILEPRKAANQYVLYNRLDIALDPFPCAGGTTSFDTMWMGVPLVTLAGKHFVSRMGVTINTNAGMPELVAQNTDEYVRIASELALDRARLKALRHNLRSRVEKSPLMDNAAFARNMEAAYREMWRTWCRTKTLDPVDNRGQ
jgi:protein O-GlcNAc transferase